MVNLRNFRRTRRKNEQIATYNIIIGQDINQIKILDRKLKKKKWHNPAELQQQKIPLQQTPSTNRTKNILWGRLIEITWSNSMNWDSFSYTT